MPDQQRTPGSWKGLPFHSHARVAKALLHAGGCPSVPRLRHASSVANSSEPVYPAGIVSQVRARAPELEWCPPLALVPTRQVTSRLAREQDSARSLRLKSLASYCQPLLPIVLSPASERQQSHYYHIVDTPVLPLDTVREHDGDVH